MPGPIDYFLLLLSVLLEASFLVCSLAKHTFRRYLFLNCYMSACLLGSGLRYYFLFRFGLSSWEYAYVYYYSDALLTIALYFALINLYLHVFSEIGVERYVRLGAVLLLAGTALVSYLVMNQSSARLLTGMAVEMSQNLYFVGVLLTYILWGAVLKLRETRVRLVQFILSLGVYFSLFAANYALRNLYPSLRFIWIYLPPLAASLLPFAWSYALLRHSEEARLATSRLAVVPR